MTKHIIFYLVLSSLVFVSTLIYGQNTSDTFYLWAKDGLTLMSSPSLSGDSLDRISYGDSIIVIEPTFIEYPLSLMAVSKESKYSRKVEPIVLEGVWIKVQASTGLEGYIPGHFLSRFEPYEKSIERGDQINLKPIQIDTLFKNTEYQHKGGLHWSVEYKHVSGIKSWRQEGGNWTTSMIEFPGATLEDVLVLLSGSWDSFKDVQVLMNWEGKTLLISEDNCRMTILKRKKMVEIIIECKEMGSIIESKH